MTFTLTGWHGRRLRSMTWTDGVLDGDPELVGRVLARVRGGETVAPTPTGPFYSAALRPARVAFVSMLDVFDGPTEATGDVPELPIDVPARAVA